jgi:hypothetical protein
MATPIKDTPILYGEDAVKFVEAVNNGLNNPVSSEEYERASKLYEKISKKESFRKIGL